MTLFSLKISNLHICAQVTRFYLKLFRLSTYSLIFSQLSCTNRLKPLTLHFIKNGTGETSFKLGLFGEQPFKNLSQGYRDAVK